MIEIHGLSHRLNGTAILSDINLTLPRGKITALIGPNGAGKSTLLGLIARLAVLQQGRITVEGLDVARTPTRQLAQVLAVLTQSNVTASRLRVAELVGFGRWPHHQGRPGPQDATIVAEALATFDLTALAGRFLDELSGGQRQRAFLAMTFAQQTDWLLLDEPLAALDMAHARSVMHRLTALRDAGKSVVVVLHEINHAAAWADHVVALKSGRVAAEGPPTEVFTADRLGGIFDMALKVLNHDGKPLVLHHL